MKVEFEILGDDDRRKLVGILAENGYSVKVEKRATGNVGNRYETESFVIVEVGVENK